MRALPSLRAARDLRLLGAQLHVSFSSQYHGAGILAGGPYWCANDNLDIALSTCMTGSVRRALPSWLRSARPDHLGLLVLPVRQPIVSELVQITKNTALSGFADDPSNLANDRVWLYSALNDTVVATSVVKATEAYCTYQHEHDWLAVVDDVSVLVCVTQTTRSLPTRPRKSWRCTTTLASTRR